MAIENTGFTKGFGGLTIKSFCFTRGFQGLAIKNVCFAKGFGGLAIKNICFTTVQVQPHRGRSGVHKIILSIRIPLTFFENV